MIYWAQSIAQPRALVPFLSTLPTAPWIMSSSIWLVGTGTIPSPVWAPGTVTSNHFEWLSPSEVRHDWVCRGGLRHCQGSRLPIKQEVSGLTSEGTGELGHWQMLVKQATSTMTKYNSYNWEQNTDHQSASPRTLIHSIHLSFPQQTLTVFLL